MTENEVVEWHPQLKMSLRKLQEIMKDRKALVCCSPWGCKDLGMT